jgi:low affinity Fe/Cu permease
MTTDPAPSHRHSHQKRFFDQFSTLVTRATGSSYAFLIAAAIVVIWGVTGPIFDYSNSWQLVINTGTTIITFLMVFVIQQSQNKDTLAIHLKLNELIASDSAANNRLVDIEDLTPEELAVLKKFYVKLARLAESDDDVHTSHSLDEADDRHKHKLAGVGKARVRHPVGNEASDAATSRDARAATSAKDSARARDPGARDTAKAKSSTRSRPGKPRP